jgi:hypothetical protein
MSEVTLDLGKNTSKFIKNLHLFSLAKNRTLGLLRDDIIIIVIKNISSSDSWNSSSLGRVSIMLNNSF